MIEDVDDLTEELERLLGGEEGNAGEGEGEAEGMSLEEQRLQLQEELATLQSKLEAVRIQEWVRSSSSYRPMPEMSMYYVQYSTLTQPFEDPRPGGRVKKCF